jgi:hypothetical protein
MRPESFKNYCPECGEEIALTRGADGHFHCPVCTCEYRYNWRAWVLVGIPGVAFGVWLTGSFASLWSAPRGLVYLFGGIIFALFWIWGHQGYVIVEHGHTPADSKDDTHAG